MILQEGIRVKFGADNRELLQSLRGGSLAAAAFKTSVVAALAGVASQSVRMAAQLDKDLRLIQTLGGEAKFAVEGLRHELGELSKEFGRNVNELARANYQAVSGGFKDINDSMELTRAGTKLAVAGNADLVGSTEAVVKALNAFDLSAQDADKAAAQLWGITRDGIITVEQLSRFLADLPISAASSGLAFEEMSAAISTLTAEGVPASTAMDQLRSAIIQMERRGITGTLVERVERFAGQGLGGIVDAVGDQTAARGILVLANNVEKLRANVSAAENVLGDYESAVKNMNSGPMAEWNKTTQELNDKLNDLGAIFLPAATAGAKGLGAAMSGVGAVLDKLAGLTTFAQTTSDWSRIGDNIRARSGAPGLFTPSTSEGAGWSGAGLPSTPGGMGAVVALYSTPNGLIPVFGAGGQTPGVPGASWPGLDSFGVSTRSNYEVPFTIDTDPNAGVSIGGSLPPEWQQRVMRGNWARGSAGALGPGSNPFPNLGANMDDFITGLGDVEVGLENVQNSSIMAGAAAGILSSSIGGLLTSALVTADSAVGRFVQGLLAQFAQLGLQRLVMSAFGLPGFATGGYTGSMGGMVHPNEYVFSADAVRSIGLGTLERAHDVAKAGGASVTINQTVNGGNPAQVADVTKHAVESALRDSRSSGTDRFYRTGGNRWR